MRSTLLVILFSGCLSLAGEPGAFTPQPNIVGQITAALVASKLDHLTSHTSQDNGKQFSYNLLSVSCLGAIERGTERVILATAFFTRSSAENSEYPPPRGYGYLLCLSTNFQLISHCSLEFPKAVTLNGTQLLREDETIADFAATGDVIRKRGFPIEVSIFLPYPFADRLPDTQE